MMLLDMLTYRRPAGSQTEREFIRAYVKPTGATRDPFGNYVLRLGESRVAWMAHTDTVHRRGGRQRIRVSRGIASLAQPAAWDCLGADDTTGVWLLVEMIQARVPGTYIFHYGEEQGCVGSRAIALDAPETLEGIDFAISLDRRGKDSVVTHQLGMRTASDAFATSLLDALAWDAAPDPTGVYTDSESYAGIVPECTNVSVGYEHQHTPKECQDLAFAWALRDRLCAFDEACLVCEREPRSVEDEDWGMPYGGKALDAWWREEEEEEDKDAEDFWKDLTA